MAENPGVSNLGRALQVRRAELGLKRRELADRSFLSYPYVSELENGAKSPSARALRQLAQALRLTPAELLAKADLPSADPDARGDEQASGLPTTGVGFELSAAYPRRTGSASAAVNRASDGIPARLSAAHELAGTTPEGPLERWIRDLVVRIVEEELAAWRADVLPDLLQQEVMRVREQSRGSARQGQDT